jgi:hypothetical protein
LYITSQGLRHGDVDTTVKHPENHLAIDFIKV